jgi:hypothetical protein
MLNTPIYIVLHVLDLSNKKLVSGYHLSLKHIYLDFVNMLPRVWQFLLILFSLEFLLLCSSFQWLLKA